jgi:hypothetical protein
MRWTIWFVAIRAESEPLVEAWENCYVWLLKESTDKTPALRGAMCSPRKIRVAFGISEANSFELSHGVHSRLWCGLWGKYLGIYKS